MANQLHIPYKRKDNCLEVEYHRSNLIEIERWARNVGGNVTVSGFEATYTAPGVLIARASPLVTTPIDCTLEEVVITSRVANNDYTVSVYKDGALVKAFDTTTSAQLDRFTATTATPVPAEASIANTSLWHVVWTNTAVTVIDCAVTLRFGVS